MKYDFDEKVKVFYNACHNQIDANGNPIQNHRYLSWERCFLHFQKIKDSRFSDIDFDYAALMFGYYLASWGMYRGSSFLLQYDYTIHCDLIKKLLECRTLFDNKQRKWEEIENACKIINEYYQTYRAKAKNTDIDKEISTTLKTKILMGMFGCTSAYDRFFSDGISEYKKENKDCKLIKSFGENSYNQLWSFYEQIKKDHTTEYRLELNNDYIYPPMKLMDMFFWQIGYEKYQDEHSST